jgi:hypothetical protein
MGFEGLLFRRFLECGLVGYRPLLRRENHDPKTPTNRPRTSTDFIFGVAGSQRRSNSKTAASGLETITIVHFQQGKQAPRRGVLADIRMILQTAGVEFTSVDAAGVKLEAK